MRHLLGVLFDILPGRFLPAAWESREEAAAKAYSKPLSRAETGALAAVVVLEGRDSGAGGGWKRGLNRRETGAEVRMRKQRKQARKAESRPQSRWPERLGEAVLIAVVIAVPLAISRYSANVCDVKDVVLAVGVSLGLALWLLASLARGRLCWAASRLNLLVLVYALWAGISIFHSCYWHATISEFGRLAAHVALYWLAIASLASLAQVRRVIAGACFAVLPVCIYGFLQAAGRDPISWETPTVRVFSFLGNATYLASFLALILPLALTAGWPHTWPERTRGVKRATWPSIAASTFFFAVAAMAALCLYLSITLSPVIGLGFGSVIMLALIVIRGGGRAILRVVVPAILVGLIALAGLGVLAYRHLPKGQQQRVQQVLHFQDPYGPERRLHRQIAFDVFRENPVLGKGFGTFRVYSLERLAPEWYTELKQPADRMLIPSYAHNEYLQALAGTGMIGGLLLLALLVGFYVTALRVSLRHPDDAWRRLGLATTVGVTAFLFQNFFGVTFRQTGPATFFWLSLGFITLAAGWLPSPGAEQSGPRLRQLRFKPLSPVALLLVGLSLCLLVGVIGWLTVRPAEANVKLQRARAAANAGNYGEAAELTDEAIHLNPYSAVSHYVSAYAWGRLAELEASADAAQKYLERSLASSKKALELLPGNASVYYNLGVTYKRLGRRSEAEQSFREAIKLMPTAVDHHAAMAELLRDQGRLAEALPYAQEAARLDPRNPKCYLLLAELAGRGGNSSEALKHLERAAGLSPRDAAVWQGVAMLSLELKEYAKALSACDNWIRLDPNSARAYNLRGVVHFRQQSYPEAWKAFSRAVQLDPHYHRARLNLALTYGRLGDYQKAVPELEKLVRGAPDTPEGQSAEMLLRRMRTKGRAPT